MYTCLSSLCSFFSSKLLATYMFSSSSSSSLILMAPVWQVHCRSGADERGQGVHWAAAGESCMVVHKAATFHWSSFEWLPPSQVVCCQPSGMMGPEKLKVTVHWPGSIEYTLQWAPQVWLQSTWAPLGNLSSCSEGCGDPCHSWAIRHQGTLLGVTVMFLPGHGGNTQGSRDWTRNYCFSDMESVPFEGCPLCCWSWSLRSP